MNAEIILNSYFTSKNTICYEKICVKWIFHNFPQDLGEIFFRNSNFLKILIYNPKRFYPPQFHKTINHNYKKYGTPNFITHRMASV